MGILSKSEIVARLEKGELLVNAYKKDGQYEVEPASYDLRSGIVIWKENDSDPKKSIVKRKDFNPALLLENQESVTIHPGQVMFVITKEEVNMPLELCGTVYAKNEFSRNG